ncbi:putative acetyltransferase [Lojkania enalia]|uniref:Acetyltransferase n=1 Tax=Lojkania enalia TaxID=147567 RepID=A0A9P4K356_9PLEO|nr:putative acetyltransferase [Didymosphaeria enalia]
MMASKSGITITQARFPDDRDVVMALFTEYAKSLGIDLAFQSFEYELASLPGKYATGSGGALYLAFASSPNANSPVKERPIGAAIGCVALRAFRQPLVCELKRLYIIPQSRGLGAGRKLLEAAIERAKEMGYKEMLLDTLPGMAEARKMYRYCGFEEVEKYYESPIEDTSFMKLRL